MLTRGTLHALELFRQRGYEAIVFHAVGTGGRAMELMMKQGIIGAVFDYAMGEISDELFHGLRAGGTERLTVAGALGLPQVLCPGGSEHLGILVSTPHQLPDRWKDHVHVWHNEVVLAPRLNVKELKMVAREVGKRLQSTRGNAVLMIPTLGTGSYAMPGGPMNDPEGRQGVLRRPEGRGALDHRDRRTRPSCRRSRVCRRSRGSPHRAHRTGRWRRAQEGQKGENGRSTRTCAGPCRSRFATRRASG